MKFKLIIVIYQLLLINTAFFKFFCGSITSQEGSPLPGYNILFEGQSQTSNSSGVFSFSSALFSNDEPLYVLISKKITRPTDLKAYATLKKFNIQSILPKQLEEKNYLLLSFNINPEDTSILQKRIPIKSSMSVPINKTMIFYLNPEYIDIDYLTKNQIKISGNTFRLPDIKVKSSGKIQKKNYSYLKNKNNLIVLKELGNRSIVKSLPTLKNYSLNKKNYKFTSTESGKKKVKISL